LKGTAMTKLTAEQAETLGRQVVAGMKPLIAGGSVSECIKLGHAAYAAARPLVLAEALDVDAYDLDPEFRAVLKEWDWGLMGNRINKDAVKSTIQTGIRIWAEIHLRELTKEPDPLRKALSRWVPEDQMGEALAAVQIAVEGSKKD
jgi:hypothetical protein